MCLVNIEARIETESTWKTGIRIGETGWNGNAGGETAEGGYIAGEPLEVQRRRTAKDSVRFADDGPAVCTMKRPLKNLT